MTQYTEQSLGLSDSSATPPAQSASEDPISTVAVQSLEAQELARQSLDFLAALALPTVFRYLFPPVFLSLIHI